VAVVVDEPMAEIDMESSPEGDIDEAAPFRDLPVLQRAPASKQA